MNFNSMYKTRKITNEIQKSDQTRIEWPLKPGLVLVLDGNKL